MLKDIVYIKEPTPLQCGQAVLAMISGKSIEEIIALCKTDRETDLATIKQVLDYCNLRIIGQRKAFVSKDELPNVCILSLETPRCWHWSLYVAGMFYDPEHGVSDILTQCCRRYYFEIGDK